MPEALYTDTVCSVNKNIRLCELKKKVYFCTPNTGKQIVLIL